MKRIICVLCLLCCGVAFAGQVTINWGTDNQTYTTTTCEVGGDVILPVPPTKRGYTFRGWKKDSFNRGTWPNWSAVPSNIDNYLPDIHNNKIPKNGDYIVVSDVGSYPVDAMIVEKPAVQSAYNVPIKYTVDGIETTVLYSRDSEIYICDGKIKISCFQSNYFSFYANVDMYYNGALLQQGELIMEQHWQRDLKFAVSLIKIEGVWRMEYSGVWEKEGIFGWTPVEQIGE